MSREAQLSSCTFGIVGSGSLAKALLPYLISKGQKVSGIWSRNKVVGGYLARKARTRLASTLDALVLDSTIIVLAVSDEALQELADVVSKKAVKGKLIVHVSGCRSLDVLRPITLAGGDTAVAHPLMTMIPRKGVPSPLEGAPIGFVCSSQKRAVALRRWAGRLGHRVFPISRSDRPLYHAAAVLACAGIHRLFLTAAQTMATAGNMPVAKAKALLGPMAEAALDLGIRATSETISGPWGRKDSQTISLHLKALMESQPQVFRLYQALQHLMKLNPDSR